MKKFKGEIIIKPANADKHTITTCQEPVLIEIKRIF